MMIQALLHARRIRRGSMFGSTDMLAPLGRFVARILPAARRVPEHMRGRCAGYAIGGAVVAGAASTGLRALAALPLGAIAGWKMALVLDRRAWSGDLDVVRRALPQAIDRASVCVLAGMSVEQALRVVAPSAPLPLRRAVQAGLQALDAGVPRTHAYERMAREAGTDEMRALVTALLRAERFGTPVASALVAQATELRSRARAAAESDARSAPLKLVFPLVLCFLPAFVVLTIGPVALSAIRTLAI